MLQYMMITFHKIQKFQNNHKMKSHDLTITRYKKNIINRRGIYFKYINLYIIF